jgi:hypothetical protein
MQNANNILKALVKEEVIATTCISSLSPKVSRKSFLPECTFNILSIVSKRNHRRVAMMTGRKHKEFVKKRKKKVKGEDRDRKSNLDLGRKRNIKIKRKRERERNHNLLKVLVIVNIDLIHELFLDEQSIVKLLKSTFMDGWERCRFCIKKCDVSGILS